ncbi:MAG: hypothetical protein JST73_11315, partial [Actinobacteria bacterium]|nr:hypothetical protein [Actinomycetota bacterium]
MTPETTPPTSDTHDGSIKVRRLGRSLRSGAAALRRRGLWIVFGALGGIIGGTLVASHQKAPVITTHFYKATAELRLDTPAQTTQTVDPVRWSLQIAQLTIVSNPYRTAVAQQAGVGFYTVESTLVAIPFQDSATLDLTAVATDPDLAARLAYHAATELNPQMAKIVDQRHHDQVLNVYASLQSANTLVNALRRLVDTAPPSQREDLLAKLQAATSQVQLLTSQSFAITTKAPVFALSGPPQAIEINQTAYGTRWVLAANDVGAARINAAASLVNVNPQDTIAMQILIKTLSEETVLPSDKKPNPAQPIGLGLLAGLVLGLSGVVLGEAWDDHIHDSLAATRATGLGVIVEIPRMSKRRVRAVLAHDPDETNRSVVDARLRYVEAAWEIAAVLGIDPHRPIDGTNGTPGVARPEAPIVLVTSTAPAEGKTTSTAALAAAFGHLGFRALAVDGDYHHRSLRGLVRPVP